MENFFDIDYFCHDLEDFINHNGFDEDGAIQALPDDWTYSVEDTTLRPVFIFTRENIINLIEQEDLTESGDELDDIDLALRDCIDFDRLNSRIPKLHYRNGKELIITKADLLEFIN